MCFKFHSTIQLLNQFLFLNNFLIGHRLAVLKWCDSDIRYVLVLTLLSVCIFSAESWIISFFNNVGIYWDSPAEEYKWGWFGTQKAYIWWVPLPAGDLDLQYINIALVVFMPCRYALVTYRLKLIIVLFQVGRLYQMLEGLGTKLEKDGLLDRYRKPELNAIYIEEWSSLAKKFLKALPYSLTSSQLSAVSEIIWDLKRPIPMNRLLQVFHFALKLLLFIFQLSAACF